MDSELPSLSRQPIIVRDSNPESVSVMNINLMLSKEPIMSQPIVKIRAKNHHVVKAAVGLKRSKLLRHKEAIEENPFKDEANFMKPRGSIGVHKGVTIDSDHQNYRGVLQQRKLESTYDIKNPMKFSM